MRATPTFAVLGGVLLSWVGAGLAQEAIAPAAKVWIGHYEEYEAFLKTARIAREESIPVGVTKPIRVYFEPGGMAESAVIKPLQPGRSSAGYFESYQSEIAAYELDKLLGLDMVPVTVERLYSGRKASAQLWVNDAQQLASLQREGQRSPDPISYSRQVRRWRVFGNLIANIDPNEGNNLVVRSPDWLLVLVDHSRAFTNRRDLVFDKNNMNLIDRPFYERVTGLTKEMLDEKVSKLVLDGSSSILRRRDAIVQHFEKLAKEKGAEAVFTP
jgi:hypothetical protein